MADVIENKVIDNYKEHEFHTSYDPHCSTCYRENRLIKARLTVTIPQIELPEPGWAQRVINKIIWGDDERYYDK